MSPLKVELDLKAVESAAARGHALDFPETSISRAIDQVIYGLAAVFNWIWVLLVILIVVNVTLRYVLGTNLIFMEELQWHLFAIGFMMGLGYALDADGHVRVDVVAENFRPQVRAWIELIGLVVVVFPLVYVIVTYAWPFVTRSFDMGEVSAAPGGLTHRWIIKAVIIVAFLYLGLAALSRLLRVTAQIFGIPRPLRH